MTDFSSQRRVRETISSLLMGNSPDVRYRSSLESASSILITAFNTESTTMPQTIPATLIPGDGIGPEIMDATLAVLAGSGRAISMG